MILNGTGDVTSEKEFTYMLRSNRIYLRHTEDSDLDLTQNAEAMEKVKKLFRPHKMNCIMFLELSHVWRTYTSIVGAAGPLFIQYLLHSQANNVAGANLTVPPRRELG